MSENGEVFSRAEAARLLDVHPYTLSRWAKVGRGPKFIKTSDAPNAATKYPVEWLRAWLRERAS